MEKRTPHHNLTNVQMIVADHTSRPFTATALRGGLELGLTEIEMRGVVLALSRRNFLQVHDYTMLTTRSGKMYILEQPRRESRYTSRLQRILTGLR